MATALTPIDAPEPYAASPADLTFTAGDATNGNEFPATGREMLIVRNDDGSAQTVTVQSVDDPFSRQGDQTQSVPAGAYRIFGPFPTLGWQQSDGTIQISVGSANVQLAVVRLPS